MSIMQMMMPRHILFAYDIIQTKDIADDTNRTISVCHATLEWGGIYNNNNNNKINNNNTITK